jgi:hypothetical protein
VQMMPTAPAGGVQYRESGRREHPLPHHPTGRPREFPAPAPPAGPPARRPSPDPAGAGPPPGQADRPAASAPPPTPSSPGLCPPCRAGS